MTAFVHFVSVTFLSDQSVLEKTQLWARVLIPHAHDPLMVKISI